MPPSLKFTIQISGVQAVQKRLFFGPQEQLQVSLALLESGRAILDDSKPGVPVLTGNLLSTGKIKGPISVAFGAGQKVVVEYGGGPSKENAGFPDPKALIGKSRVTYAAKQHETNPRRPKWLEKAFQMEAPKVAGKVAARLMMVLGRRVRLK